MKRFAFVFGVFWLVAMGASAQALPGEFSVEQNGVPLAGSQEEVAEDAPEKSKA